MANIEIRSVDNLAGTGVPYAYAVKAGPWLFLTGHEAFDFATGHAPEVEGHAGFPDFGAPRLKREAEYILKRMRATLAEFGSDFRHSVRVDQYYPVFEAVRAYQLARHGEFGDYIPPSTSVLMERLLKAQIYVPTAADIPDALDVWHQHVKAPCALTAVPTKGFGFIDGVVEINLLALRDGAKRRKEVLKVDLPAMSSYGACIRAGELVFASGLTALGADGHVIGKTQSPAFDALAHSSQVQALAVYSGLDKICKAAGTGLSSIVRAQYFMRNARKFAGRELAWMSRLGKQPHPFVCVQVPGTLPAPGASFTADFWIYAP